jgi:lysozyme
MYLRLNDTGPNVTLWQTFLLTRGLSIGRVGEMDANTVAATKLFQAANGLAADGIVGHDTETAAISHGFAGFPAPATMQPSDKCVDFIKGFEACELKVYDDGFGYPTVGYGHRTQPEDRLSLGDTISQAQADAFFVADLREHARPVNNSVKVHVTQGQYDAMVSLCFNIGGTNFQDSAVLARVNRGDYDGAREGFDHFITSRDPKTRKRVVVRGLQRRRDAEQEMWDS